MNNQTIELVKKFSWDETVKVPDEVIAVDTSTKKSILVATANQVSLFNSRGAVDLRTSFPEKICCVSLHPSGNHVVLGSSQERLLLANILVDQIRVFHEIKTCCTDLKFNLTGSVFSVIVGQSIEVYDFISGAKINLITCDKFFDRLRWGFDCQMYATSKDNKLLCHWDAISGKSMSEFQDTGILGVAITVEGNVIVTSSSNSIFILNSDLTIKSKVQIDESFVLGGPIAVSDEGLAFVFMRNQETSVNVDFLKIISLVGQEQFDQPMNETIHVMTVSSGRLITNNSLYSIKDHRGINQSIITAVEIEESKHEEDSSDVLTTSAYLEHQAATLQDVRSRLTDLEILIDLEFKSTKDQIASSMEKQAESNSRELSSENSKLDTLRQCKDDTAKECLQMLEQAKATSEREVKEHHQKNKLELMRQVNHTVSLSWFYCYSL